jgi:hypothetical protein
MKFFLSLIFAIITANCFSQETLKLKINNPQPRVGQSVSLNFDIRFFTDFIESQIEREGKIETATSYTSTNNFERNLVFQEAGVHTIGPLRFNINNIDYVTDTLVITVIEPLLPQEGLWIRLVEQNGRKYMLVEQMIANESNFQEKENGFSYTVGGELNEGKEFAELVDVSVKGVRFNFRNSSTRSVRSEGAKMFEPGFSYSYKKYDIEFDDSFSGELKLSKKHFINFPAKTKLEKILITN